jgi:hypothetical protein
MYSFAFAFSFERQEHGKSGTQSGNAFSGLVEIES